MHIASKNSVTGAIEALYRASSFKFAAQTLLSTAKTITGCQSALLRMVSEDEWIPFHAWDGATADFMKDESLICKEDCVCGQVACGAADNSLPFFTEQGTFATDNIGKFVSHTKKVQSPWKYRLRCVNEGYRSVAVFPIKDGEEIVGVLHIASNEESKFQAKAVEDMECICAHAGGALSESTFRVEKERSLLVSLTQSLLPERANNIEGLSVGFFHRGASDPEVIGGDFYDIIATANGKTAFIIGDFSGHGVAAAGMAARCRFTLATILAEIEDPAVALTKANALLSKTIPENKFATVACAIVDLKAGELLISLAGHPPLIKIDAKGNIGQAGESAPPLAVMDDTAYVNQQMGFKPGDVLVAFTDGIIETRDIQGALFGYSRVSKLCKIHAQSEVQEIALRLCVASEDFAGSVASQDDKMVVVLKNESVYHL